MLLRAVIISNLMQRRRDTLFILILSFSNTVFGQGINGDIGNGKVVFGFTKTVDGKKVIINPLNGGSIKGDELINATNILAFFKTTKANLKIDSIYYEMHCHRGEDHDPQFFEAKGFDWKYTDWPAKMVKIIGAKKGTVLIFTITKIILENGKVILYPDVENKKVYSRKFKIYKEPTLVSQNPTKEKGYDYLKSEEKNVV